MTATFAVAQTARPLPEIHVSRRVATAAAAVVGVAAAYVVVPTVTIAAAVLLGPAIILSFVAREAGAFEDLDTVLTYTGPLGGIR